MRGIEPCPRQPSESGGSMEEGLVPDVKLEALHSTPIEIITTTTTTTVVSTARIPMPTSAAHPTQNWPFPPTLSSSLIPRTTSSRPTPSNALSSVAPILGDRHAFPSSAIIGIIVAVVVLLSILAFYLAWRRRKRQKKVALSRAAGVRPFRLPRFSFEIPYGTTSSSFTAEITSRLNKAMMTSLVGVADDRDHTTTRHHHQTKNPNGAAARGNMIVYAPSFGLRSPTKATVVNTFITGRLDELPVAVGQSLYILGKYDDGWTFCANEKGDQGMVPVECLAVSKGMRY